MQCVFIVVVTIYADLIGILKYWQKLTGRRRITNNRYAIPAGAPTTNATNALSVTCGMNMIIVIEAVRRSRLRLYFFNDMIM
jgi:hypothetical protein